MILFREIYCSQEVNMDKKIKKIMKKEESAIKDTKNLLKLDRKQDKKIKKCGLKPY